MKTILVPILLATLTMPVSAAPIDRVEGNTQSTYPTDFGPLQNPETRAYSRLRIKLRDLRAEALKLRDADGGTLTPEHDAYIQAKLDAAQAEYRRYGDAAIALSLDRERSIRAAR